MRQRRSRPISGQTKSSRAVEPMRPMRPPRSRSVGKWTQPSRQSDVRRLSLTLREQSPAMQGSPELPRCKPRAARLQRYSMFSGMVESSKGRGHTDERRERPCRDGTAPQKLRFKLVSTLVRMAGRRAVTTTRRNSMAGQGARSSDDAGWIPLAPVRIDASRW
jgi:hypothetical protein